MELLNQVLYSFLSWDCADLDRRHPGSPFLWVPFFLPIALNRWQSLPHRIPKHTCWGSKFSVTQSRQSSLARSFMQELRFFPLPCLGPRARLLFLRWREHSSLQPTELYLLTIPCHLLRFSSHSFSLSRSFLTSGDFLSLFLSLVMG